MHSERITGPLSLAKNIDRRLTRQRWKPELTLCGESLSRLLGFLKAQPSDTPSIQPETCHVVFPIPKEPEASSSHRRKGISKLRQQRSHAVQVFSLQHQL